MQIRRLRDYQSYASLFRNYSINKSVFKIFCKNIQFKFSTIQNTCYQQLQCEMGTAGDEHIPGSQVEVAQPGPHSPLVPPALVELSQ